MAASGFTPISLYYSTTASAVPTSGNLANGELGLNIADMKLYAKNSAGVVTLLASNAGASGSVTSVAATVPAFLSIAGSPITTSGTLAITLSGTALPIANGGTGTTSTTFANLTTNVTGTLPVANGGTGITSTPTNGQIPIGNGTTYTAATLTAGTGVTITNASGSITINATGTGGTVTSVAATVPSFLSIAGSPITTSGTLAISLSGTALPTTSGGTGLTSFTSGGVVYASSTSALATGSGLVFDGTNLAVGTTISATRRVNILSGAGITPLAAVGPNGYLLIDNTGAGENYYSASSAQIWVRSGTEQMRLTSTGLGIGTTAPRSTLNVVGDITLGATPAATVAGTAYSITGNSGSSGNAAGGNLTINAGGGSGVTANGDLTLRAGQTVSPLSTTTGGNVIIESGKPSNSGTSGYIAFNSYTGNPSAVVERLRITTTGAFSFGSTGTATGTSGQVLTSGGSSAAPTWATPATGTVTSVGQSFTGGLISVAGSPVTTSGTLALTVAGTSGGIPYFSSASTWATSAALTQYGVVYGGGAGGAPVSTAAGTTGQVLTATTGGAPTWAAASGGSQAFVAFGSTGGF